MGLLSELGAPAVQPLTPLHHCLPLSPGRYALIGTETSGRPHWKVSIVYSSLRKYSGEAGEPQPSGQETGSLVFLVDLGSRLYPSHGRTFWVLFHPQGPCMALRRAEAHCFKPSSWSEFRFRSESLRPHFWPFCPGSLHLPHSELCCAPTPDVDSTLRVPSSLSASRAYQGC